jgi:polyphosphate kinase 2
MGKNKNYVAVPLKTNPADPALELASELEIPGIGKFDLDNPKLAKVISEQAIESGGYPYDDRMDRDDYEDELERLQIELVKFLAWIKAEGKRIVVLFEGRDAAGKGGSINAFTSYLNRRSARTVALPKPSDTERGQWYFQRYVAHLPTAGELVLFDRSWYNRAGVEPVMGFCSDDQHQRFLDEAPHFEEGLVRDDIIFFKFWLSIGREMQLKRFHDRRHDPLKVWKLSSIDIKAMTKWDDYSAARNEMLAKTHRDAAPWTIVRYNDKRRGRINAIRHVLGACDYAGKDHDAISPTDPKILGFGPDYLSSAE